MREEVGVRLQDLPVAIALPDPLADEVAAWVETEAGWQVVARQGPPQPVLLLTSALEPGLPCVVITLPGDPLDLADAALRGGALDVVSWPGERQRLLHAPLRIRGNRASAPAPTSLRLAGAAGGVGTSTIALALGGIVAWSGRRTLVVGGDDLLVLCGVGPWTGAGAAELAALPTEESAAEVEGIAVAVRGVPGMAVLRGDAEHVRDLAGWPFDVVISDLRRNAGAADLVVARADAHLRAALAVARSARRLLVVESFMPRGQVRRLVGRTAWSAIPSSHRVARAGLTGRVPSGLPGSWIAALRAGLGGAA